MNPLKYTNAKASRRALIALFLFTASTSFAQDLNRFGLQGTLEAGGSFSYTSQTSVLDGNTGNNVSILMIAPYIGYFVSDNFELGVNPLGVTQVSTGFGSVYQLRMFAAPAYHFRSLGTDYAFVEPLLGYTAQLNGDTFSGFSWGGRAGVKFGVTEGGLLVLAVQYLVIDLSPSGATSRTGYNELSFSAGFTVWK